MPGPVLPGCVPPGPLQTSCWDSMCMPPGPREEPRVGCGSKGTGTLSLLEKDDSFPRGGHLLKQVSGEDGKTHRREVQLLSQGVGSSAGARLALWAPSLGLFVNFTQHHLLTAPKGVVRLSHPR